jgi:hypothetical protein
MNQEPGDPGTDKPTMSLMRMSLSSRSSTLVEGGRAVGVREVVGVKVTVRVTVKVEVCPQAGEKRANKITARQA